MSQQASQQFQKLKADVNKLLHEPNPVNNVLGIVEQKTTISRFNLVAGIAGVFALYLIFGHFAQLVCNAIGFLYPAYVSIKAIESHNKDDDTQWLTYWVIFALFNVLEFGAETIESYFPIYWLTKCIFVLYLYMPMTLGAQKIYHKVVRPFVMKHQATIDQRLGGMAQKAQDTVRQTVDEHFKPN